MKNASRVVRWPKADGGNAFGDKVVTVISTFAATAVVGIVFVALAAATLSSADFKSLRRFRRGQIVYKLKYF